MVSGAVMSQSNNPRWTWTITAGDAETWIRCGEWLSVRLEHDRFSTSIRQQLAQTLTGSTPATALKALAAALIPGAQTVSERIAAEIRDTLADWAASELQEQPGALVATSAL